jgi:hypothetical protein
MLYINLCRHGVVNASDSERDFQHLSHDRNGRV